MYVGGVCVCRRGVVGEAGYVCLSVNGCIFIYVLFVHMFQSVFNAFFLKKFHSFSFLYFSGQRHPPHRSSEAPRVPLVLAGDAGGGDIG